MKVLNRFKQGGGLRLVKAYFKMGLLAELMKAGLNILFKRRRYQNEYARFINKVKPLLIEEFDSVLTDLEKLTKKPETVKEPTTEKKEYVWFCWLQGIDKAPDIVKACLDSQTRWLNNKEFVIITAENYKEYISLPVFITEKYAKGVIPHALFTDLIRTELLTRHGGSWIDATVMITGKNYPKEIFDCNLFMPQYIGEDGTMRGISNWLITARKENYLLILLRGMLLEYWKRYDCVVDYYIFHLFFGMIAQRHHDEIKAMPILNSYHCIELLKHLGERGQQENLKGFLSNVSIHKLSYRLGKEILEDKENVLHELQRMTNHQHGKSS